MKIAGRNRTFPPLSIKAANKKRKFIYLSQEAITSLIRCINFTIQAKICQLNP